MKDYLTQDPWKVIEEGFHPEFNKVSESIFSIGNGFMGGRANFEEDYSGPTLLGNYIGGVYYPDKTRVGWWKNGYPDYYAKVLNAVHWSKLQVSVDGEIIDFHTAEVLQFRRVLDMQKGLLSRSAVVRIQNGRELEIRSERFYSLKRTDIACMRYEIKALNFDADLIITSALDFDVQNEDSNYEEKFWVEHEVDQSADRQYISAKTLKTEFIVAAEMQHQFGNHSWKKIEENQLDKYIDASFLCEIKKGTSVCFEKIVAMPSSFHYSKDQLKQLTIDQLNAAVMLGYEGLRHEQIQVWKDKWDIGDIEIEGDIGAQQAIRFNISNFNRPLQEKIIDSI